MDTSVKVLLASTTTCQRSKMSLLRYKKPVGGLPDSRGSLSSAIPSQEIAAANVSIARKVSIAQCTF